MIFIYRYRVINKLLIKGGEELVSYLDRSLFFVGYNDCDLEKWGGKEFRDYREILVIFRIL